MTHTLTIRLRHAEFLPEIQSISQLSRIYCTVQLGAQSFKSNVQSKGIKYFSWDEEYQFRLSAKDRFLIIQVFEESQNAGKRPLAEGFLEISALTKSAKLGHWVELIGNGKLVGEVLIKSSYIRSIATSQTVTPFMQDTLNSLLKKYVDKNTLDYSESSNRQKFALKVDDLWDKEKDDDFVTRGSTVSVLQYGIAPDWKSKGSKKKTPPLDLKITYLQGGPVDSTEVEKKTESSWYDRYFTKNISAKAVIGTDLGSSDDEIYYERRSEAFLQKKLRSTQSSQDSSQRVKGSDRPGLETRDQSGEKEVFKPEVSSEEALITEGNTLNPRRNLTFRSEEEAETSLKKENFPPIKSERRSCENLPESHQLDKADSQESSKKALNDNWLDKFENIYWENAYIAGTNDEKKAQSADSKLGLKIFKKICEEDKLIDERREKLMELKKDKMDAEEREDPAIFA